MFFSVSTSVATTLFTVSFVNSAPFALLPIVYIPCVFPSLLCLVNVVVSPAAYICFISVTSFPSMSIIFTGNHFVSVVAFPNCPHPLYPTPNAVPSSFNNTVCNLPFAISFIPYKILLPSSVLICCGNIQLFVLFNPNCPYPLYPVFHTLPSASNIVKYCCPAEICIIFDTFCIFVG